MNNWANHFSMSVIVFLSVITTSHAALIGLYQFDDANNLGADSSGHNHTLTNNYANYTASGYQAGAVSLNGSAWLQSQGIDPNPTALPQLTWGAWVKPSTISAPYFIQSVISADNGGYDRDINIDRRGGNTWSVFAGSISTSDYMTGYANNNYGVFGSGISPATSEWTFLAAVYDQNVNSMTFYVNDQSFQITTNFGSSQNYFTIGRNPGSGSYEDFHGLIDNVFVYDEALSLEQITSVYQGRYTFSSAIPEPTSAILIGLGLITLLISLERHIRSDKQLACG
ncbi:LamG domain-containing protein [Rhodopseudomonas palustris]|uniref:LamG domain-containing protein n=1 Tax=Thiospirillum jenense TaxID=1653858 RepID=A0A839HL66_9GAMM|nr:LamG domain-containing protein [Thiospirillum jenense]MBB1093766.1 LamG domain-containing protein [Rhodopseudomonas palustris]MBB1127227.1 LamG domain-containing protein [Thiospirillum jenense]